MVTLTKFARMQFLLAAILLLGLSEFSSAQNFPSKPIRVVVPYPAGGPTDSAARVMAEGLQKQLGQPVIIENRPGQGSLVGTEYFSKLEPSGHSILVTSSFALYELEANTSKGSYFDKQFVAVSTIAENPYVLCANPKLSIRTLQDLKALPPRSNLGYVGASPQARNAPVSVAKTLGLQLNMVPYKNYSDLTIALNSGEMQLALVLSTGSFGKSCVLRFSNAQFSIDTIPNANQFGLSQPISPVRYYAYLPTATPKAIVERLGKAIDLVKASADYKERISRMALTVPGPDFPFADKQSRDDMFGLRKNASTGNDDPPTCPSGEVWCHKTNSCRKSCN